VEGCAASEEAAKPVKRGVAVAEAGDALAAGERAVQSREEGRVVRAATQWR